MQVSECTLTIIWTVLIRVRTFWHRSYDFRSCLLLSAHTHEIPPGGRGNSFINTILCLISPGSQGNSFINTILCLISPGGQGNSFINIILCLISPGGQENSFINTILCLIVSGLVWNDGISCITEPNWTSQLDCNKTTLVFSTIFQRANWTLVRSGSPSGTATNLVGTRSSVAWPCR